MKRIIGTIIWNTKEFFGISLGKFAPTVFGWMIGAKPVKVEDKEEESYLSQICGSLKERK